MATPGSYLTPTNTTTRTANIPTAMPDSRGLGTTSSNGGMERSGSGGMQPMPRGGLSTGPSLSRTSQQIGTQQMPTSDRMANTNVYTGQQRNPYDANRSSTYQGNQMQTQGQSSAPRYPGTQPLDPWQPNFNSYDGPPGPPPGRPGNTVGQGGGEASFFGGDGGKSMGMWDTNQFKSNDSQVPNYISSVLPVAQFAQNNFQYRNDFNEQQRLNDRNYGRDVWNDTFQQGLSTRQQQAAEWQANTSANQWDRQFGHTQFMDEQGLGLRGRELDLQGTQIGNQFTMGMDANQATRDVAGTYAKANMYGADKQLAGTQYQSDKQLAGTQYASDQERIAAMYGSDNMLRGTQYASDAERQASMYGADRGVDVAGIYGGATRYGADQQFAGTRYQTDAEREIAAQQNQFLYSQLAQQAQQQQLERENQMRMSAMATYGRSQAPAAQWARGWN